MQTVYHLYRLVRSTVEVKLLAQEWLSMIGVHFVDWTLPVRSCRWLKVFSNLVMHNNQLLHLPWDLLLSKGMSFLLYRIANFILFHFRAKVQKSKFKNMSNSFLFYLIRFLTYLKGRNCLRKKFVRNIFLRKKFVRNIFLRMLKLVKSKL